MQTTRWKDNRTKSLDDSIKLLTSEHPDDSPDEATGYTNWVIKKSFETNENMTLNGRIITYNHFKYSYDQVVAGDQPLEDRTVKKEGFIIAFSNGPVVNYIISRNSDAQKILRKILNYSGKNEIEKNASTINSDLFFWLINKVYSGDNTIENIEVDSVRGFKGDTDDLLTTVSASGESVMNIISTLSFFLESQKLNQIKIDIQYEEHKNIELQLSTKSTIATSIDRYSGILEKLPNDESILTQLILTIYIEIIPIILQAYLCDIENKVWTSEANIDFLTRVADDLSDKVKRKVDSLRKPT